MPLRRIACAFAATLALAATLAPAAPAAPSGGRPVPSAGTAAPGRTATPPKAPRSPRAGNDSSRPSGPTGGARPGAYRKPPREEPKPERDEPKKPEREEPKPDRDDSKDDRGDGPNNSDIPAEYMREYRSAGESKRVSWRLLAAIGKLESDHGRSRLPGVRSGVNGAGCCAGPMQICTMASCGNTWQAYARDGDGDGRKSVYEPADAIHAAAALVSQLNAMFGNHPAFILAGYNAGPGNVQKYKGVPPFAETQAYVRRGLDYMRGLR